MSIYIQLIFKNYFFAKILCILFSTKTAKAWRRFYNIYAQSYPQ